jgi:putative DNA primase/helicase
MNNQETTFSLTELHAHMNELTHRPEPIAHNELLMHLAEQFSFVDFLEEAFPEVKDLRKRLNNLKKELQSSSPDDSEKLNGQIKTLSDQIAAFNLTQKHIYIIAVEEIIRIAEKNSWGLCKHNDFIYVYNGCFWSRIENAAFQKFISKALLKMGVMKFIAKDFKFIELTFKQFLAEAYLPAPVRKSTIIVINLKNGTLEIEGKNVKLRPFDRKDFLTYQLPFEYNPHATAPLFMKFLKRVLPDEKMQLILSEFMGYIFVPTSYLCLEKALMLYGNGANGKSVFFNIINALLGDQNISNYSLQSLTNETGYYRAYLGDKLCNYASEISTIMQAAVFKQLVSGEPVEARLPYGNPFTLKDYAKLIFNTNILPRDVEFTTAFFRRFLIIPFDVTIPKDEQDPELSQKIIQLELAGVFNWVMQGLDSVLTNKSFSKSDRVDAVLTRYETESDSVKQFISENTYQVSASKFILIKQLYLDYRIFCAEDGLRPVKKSSFIQRLEALNILIERKSIGNVAFITL